MGIRRESPVLVLIKWDFAEFNSVKHSNITIHRKHKNKDQAAAEVRRVSHQPWPLKPTKSCRQEEKSLKCCSEATLKTALDFCISNME